MAREIAKRIRDLEKIIDQKYNLGRLFNIELISDSPTTQVFSASCAEDELVIKIASDATESKKLRSCAEVMDRLGTTGISAELIKTKNDEASSTFDRKRMLIYKKVNGRTPSNSLQLHGAIGTLLGQLHSVHVEDFAHERIDINKLTDYWRRCYQNLPDKGRSLEHNQLTNIIENFPAMNSLPQAFIHGDPHAGNIIRRPTGSYTLIDFAQGGVGPRLFDVAYVLTALGTGYRLNFSKLQAARKFMSSYCEYVNLTQKEIKSLPYIMDFHLLSFAIDWRVHKVSPENVRRYYAFKQRLLPLFLELGHKKTRRAMPGRESVVH